MLGIITKLRGLMEVRQNKWEQVHKVDVPQRSVSGVPSDAKTIMPREGALEIRFVGPDTSDIAEIEIYLARRSDDPILAARGSIQVGRQACERGFYCDMIDLVPCWLSKISVTNAMGSIARVCMETHGYHRIFVRVNGLRTWYVDMAGMNSW
jgi:hypothetical protein